MSRKEDIINRINSLTPEQFEMLLQLYESTTPQK